jgi:hypothetical protein
LVVGLLRAAAHVSRSSRRLGDVADERGNSLALSAHGEHEGSVVRQDRPVTGNRLVDHQVPTAILHDTLELLDRLQQIREILARLVTAETDAALPEARRHLVGHATALLVARIRVLARRLAHVRDSQVKDDRDAEPSRVALADLGHDFAATSVPG